MCGFVGIRDAARGVEPATVLTMTRSLAHRGPDDEGVAYLDPLNRTFVTETESLGKIESFPFGMGFRRLSILDLSTHGHQPMLSPSGRFAITLNGEIYNYRELRKELASDGRVFMSDTDTEVVLALYERFGPRMLAQLNGMFAIAVMDAATGELFLARDRMGIKPLYTWVRDGVFLYASEIKAFLFHPRFRRVLDQARLDEQLLFRYIGDPDTLLEGVRAVEPGTFVVVREGALQAHRYWRIPISQPDPMMGNDDHAAALEDLMRSSVRYQLISDVTVGCQLSGGVDSSLVSAWAAEEHPGLFDSVSVIFREASVNEERYIDQVNAQLGFIGHKTMLEPSFVCSELERATWHHDTPLNHPNSLGILRLSEEARRHVTVLLSGEGADEVLGGYQRFSTAAWLDRSCQVRFIRRLGYLARYLEEYGTVERALVGLSAFGSPELVAACYPSFSLDRALAHRMTLWNRLDGEPLLERFLTYEQQTYLPDVLMRQDRMSMAHSIENRVPFLDHRVVEFAKRLPTGLKVELPRWPWPERGRYRTKRIVKRLASRRYGRSFAYRSKGGFRLPLQEWCVSAEFAAMFRKYRQALGRTGWFDVSAMDSLMRIARTGEVQAVRMVWTLMALGAWLVAVVERPIPTSQTTAVPLASGHVDAG